MKDTITILLLLALVCVAMFLYFKFFKMYKVKNIVFVDGSLGTGKSFYCVSLAVRLYKSAKRKYYIKRFLFKYLPFKVFKEKYLHLEKPMLYSNIRLRNIEFVKVTKSLFYRQNYRFAYGSVILLDEFSLIADQYSFKDRELSERLSLFFKLLRHELRGGYCVINSQSTSDLHYSLKYVLSDYLYIHHKYNIPFFSILRVQEMAYCGDKDGSQVTNVRNEDLEDTLKTMIVSSKYYRYYDTYCYSIFTDDLPSYVLSEKNAKRANLKDIRLVSLKEYKYLMENVKEKLEDVSDKSQESK